MNKDAVVNGEYRYWLARWWACLGNGRVLFVMLNPSTADATKDDPTIRRCIDFAKREGYTRLEVVNLYALRATDPKELKWHPSPIGPNNAREIETAAKMASAIVCAWGNNAPAERAAEVLAQLRRDAHCPIFHLGLTKSGQPKHPLYLRADQPFIRW